MRVRKRFVIGCTERDESKEAGCHWLDKWNHERVRKRFIIGWTKWDESKEAIYHWLDWVG